MARLSRHIIRIALLLTLTSLVAAFAVMHFLVPQLPDARVLKDVELQTPLRIYSAEGALIAEFGEQRRIPVRFEQIPPRLIQAFLAAEDDRFYSHPGVDYQGLLRASLALLATRGDKSQGGSTITMQVARNFFLSREKTYLRKLNEILLAFQIEQLLTKDEIITLYLNKIFLGQRAYGVAAAAEVYYGKTLEALTLAEMATLAGLPKAPSTTNPIANPERAKQRRDYVLRRMLQEGYIDRSEFEQARQSPIATRYHGREVEIYAPYAAEIIRGQLEAQYGEAIYTSGLNVTSTIRAAHQRAAQQSVQSGLLIYDRRHGYRGPESRIDLTGVSQDAEYAALLEGMPRIGILTAGVVSAVNDTQASVYVRGEGWITLTLDTMQWARPYLSANSMGKTPERVGDVLAVGDIIRLRQDEEGRWLLSQVPDVQAALVALDSQTGAVTAIQGGYDFFHSKFNRATQTSRQPGSSFKPFLFSAALEKGYTAATIINDAPVVYEDAGLENVWRPENYSGRFFGPTRMREAMVNSLNLVAIRILRDIGITYAAEYIERFGFTPSQVPRNLSMSLGSGSTAPIDLARGFAVFANGGFLVEPHFIQHIESARGERIYTHSAASACNPCVPHPERTPAERVITAQNAYLINSMLSDVIRHGTGRAALSLNRADVAGKTGTTNDQFDAWFAGYNPDVVAVAWVGFDQPQTLGQAETGGRAALPIWTDFMRDALEATPVIGFQQPVGLVSVRINKDTGLLAQPGDPNTMIEVFRNETVPRHPAGTGSSQAPVEQPELFDLF